MYFTVTSYLRGIADKLLVHTNALYISFQVKSVYEYKTYIIYSKYFSLTTAQFFQELVNPDFVHYSLTFTNLRLSKIHAKYT